MNVASRLSSRLQQALSSSRSGSIALTVTLDRAAGTEALEKVQSVLAGLGTEVRALASFGILRGVVPRNAVERIAALDGVTLVDVDQTATIRELLD